MNTRLIKHILYMLRRSCNSSEFQLVFNQPNQNVEHEFIVKSNYIGYTRREGGDPVMGFDCTDLDILKLNEVDLTPVSYTKVLYNYDKDGIYSTETINLRYEVEIVVRLAKEFGNNCFLCLENASGQYDLVYLDGMMFWCEEKGDTLYTYTCGVYDLRKVFGNYKISWVYGKSPYSKPFNFYSAKERIARAKGKQYKKIRRG